MLDTLTLDYSESLFSLSSRQIYDQEDADLAAIRKSCIHNGTIHPPQYVTEVGKYLVRRTAQLADAKREALLTAVTRAKLPFDESVLGEITSMVLDFCNRQQHQEIGFLASHIARLPGLNNVPEELKAAVVVRIQTGISGVMDAAKDKMKVRRYETMLDARHNQGIYATALGKRWDVFISHASEDKNDFVEPLAIALQASGLNVWYDKTALTVGDHLRQKIDEGLSQCQYGIVVLSNHFFAKQWPKEELEGLFAREIAGAPGVKVILPVWHNITKDEVVSYSPILAGRVAANSNAGLAIVVAQLRSAMGL